MKCPKCGAWNAAYLPKCTQCGAPLPNAPEGPAAWEESLHKKKPSLEITTQGHAASRRSAEQEAATAALEILKNRESTNGRSRHE